MTSKLRTVLSTLISKSRSMNKETLPDSSLRTPHGVLRVDTNDPKPWWMPSVVQFVQHHLKPQHQVLEFGSGMSTLWLAQRTQRLYSVEEESFELFELLEKEIKPPNIVKWQMVPPPEFTWDWLILDGGDRVAHGLKYATKMNDGGIIVLDDSERVYEYFPLLSLFNRWEHKDFYDIMHTEHGPKQRMTTVWRVDHSR